MKIVYLTRVYHFCAGHRLLDSRQDDAWNVRVFGKCSSPGGHGHNYRAARSERLAAPPPNENGRVRAGIQIVEAGVREVVDLGAD